jgi:hypothetical protein
VPERAALAIAGPYEDGESAAHATADR